MLVCQKIFRTLRKENIRSPPTLVTIEQSTLLNSGVEEALSNLSPAKLIQLEKNVQKLKKQKSTTGTPGDATPRPPNASAPLVERMGTSTEVAHIERVEASL